MKSYWLWGLVAVLTAIVLVGYFQFTEEYETQIWTGQSKEARVNPYLAAQKFLESRDVVIESTLDTLNFDTIDVGDIVVLTEVDSMLVSKSRIDAALNWVERGGFLLVGANQESEAGSSILDHFDINVDYQDIEIADSYIDQDGDELTTAERMEEANRKIDERIAERAAQKAEREAEKVEGDADTSNSKDQDQENSNSDEEADSDFDSDLFDILNANYRHEFFKAYISNPDDEIHLAVLDRFVFVNDDDDEYDYDDYQDEDYSDLGDEGHDYSEYSDASEYDEALDDSFIDDHSEDASDDAYTETVSNEKYTLAASIDDEHGSRFLQYQYGQGYFTVVSSLKLWQNNYIGLGDHAYFLSYLVPNESRLHLFYNISSPSISQILGQYFYEAIYALLAFLALWLWWRGIRVQSTIETVEGQRRNFAEHLSSSAKYLVANKQYAELLDPIKDDIEQQMRLFYPNYSQLNQQAQLAMLLERTNIKQSTLQQWLVFCAGVSSQQQLLAAIKIGNAIRKQL